MQIGREEFFRGSEAPCDESSRFHQIAQRILHGLIVINDRYQSGRFVHRHAARLTRSPHWEQSNFRLTEPDFRRVDPYYRKSCEGNIDFTQNRLWDERRFENISSCVVLRDQGGRRPTPTYPVPCATARSKSRVR